jgi:hypothetical protein
MNAALEVLSEIQRRGVTLLVRDGKLIARPISAVPSDLAERARQHRLRLSSCLAVSPTAKLFVSPAWTPFGIPKIDCSRAASNTNLLRPVMTIF